MKSVLIVGAGPAGLVAAKSLLQHKDGEDFEVTIFETADRIGGMWRVAPGDVGDKCSPDMPTNLSRFTVTFPDLAWQSVALEKPDIISQTTSVDLPREAAPPPFLRTGLPPSTAETALQQCVPTAAPVVNSDCLVNKSSLFSGEARDRRPGPLFPKAWQVGRYLNAYAKKYIPGGVVQLNRRLASAELSTQSKQWKITSVDQQTRTEHTDVFDYLVVASGFFDSPVASIKPVNNSIFSSASITHSSRFREIAALGNKRGKIVVVGGGISGTEAAATAASQISSAKHSPGQKPNWCESIVYHVFDRPFYTLPRYLPLKPFDPLKEKELMYNRSPLFLPLDLVLYDLAYKGKDPIFAANGLASAEKALKGHGHLKIITGADDTSPCAEYVYKEEETQYPVSVSLSDTYVEFVRSGYIVPVRGRVGEVRQGAHSDTFSLDVSSDGDWSFKEEKSTTTIEGVVGVIEATGFRAGMDYLSDGVKQALSWDPDCRRVPFLLSRGSIFNPNVPNIAFVGFYEGPYWNVMDMQARVIAHTWGKSLEPDVKASLYDVSESASVREAIKNRSRHVPQFWMADHAGLVEELARVIGVQRDDSAFGGQQGPPLSARYQGRGVNEETTKIVLEVANLLSDSPKTEWSNQMYKECISTAIFRGIQGDWEIKRTVEHKPISATNPESGWTLDGKFEGNSQLHPRRATAPGACDATEYLYEEEGTWDSVDGTKCPGTGSCVFHLDRDVFTIWTAKHDGAADRLFHTPTFYAREDPKRGWLAGVTHRDNNCEYSTTYEFQCKGVKINTWKILHTVTIQNMVYKHQTIYVRPVPKLGGKTGRSAGKAQGLHSRTEPTSNSDFEN